MTVIRHQSCARPFSPPPGTDVVAVIEAAQLAGLMAGTGCTEITPAPLLSAPLAAVDLTPIVQPAQEEHLAAKPALLHAKAVHARLWRARSKLALQRSLSQSGGVFGLPAN